MKRWVFILTGVLFAVLALSTAAQDSTPQPGETPTLPFTEIPPATETPLPAPTATFTPPPPTETIEVTPTFTLTPSETPFAEPTLIVSETPVTIPTLTAAPTLPVASWSVIYSDSYITVDETIWQFTGAGWGFEPQSDGGGRLIVFNSTAPVFYRTALTGDSAIEAQVDVAQGSASLYVRHSGAFTYEARLDSSGIVTLLRAGVVLASVQLPDFSPALPQRVRLNSLGAQLWVEVDGVTQLAAIDPTPLPPGQVGFAASFPASPAELTPVPPQHIVGFDDVTIWQPSEQVTLTPQPSLTPTLEPTFTPITFATPAPTSAALVDSGSEGESEAAEPALRSFSAAAADTDYRLVRAGDVDGLYAAVNDANAGLITTIYLNADRPFNPGNRPDADYVLPDRINITGDVIIHANGAVLERDIYTDENGPYATERGPGRGRVFFIAPGATLRLHHALLRNTNIAPLPASFVGDGYGGAIRNSGTTHIFDTVVVNNTAGPGGGGILNFGSASQLFLTRVTFTDNFAGGGGAIQNDGGGQVTAECVRFEFNSAGYGGALLNGNVGNNTSRITIYHSAFVGNSTILNRGSAVFNLVPNDALHLNLSNNWWGPAGILPDDLTDDADDVSFDIIPTLDADPTVPDALGNYAHTSCQPVIPEAALTLQLRVNDPTLDPANLIVGQIVPISAIVTNTGDAPTTESVTLTLRVPNGLAPLEVSTRGDTLNVFEILLNLLFEIITRILGGSTLAIGRQDTFVNFSYDVGVLAPGETRPVELELVVRPTFAGTFTVEGNATTDAAMAAGMFGATTLDTPHSSPALNISTSLVLQVNLDCSVTTTDTEFAFGNLLTSRGYNAAIPLYSSPTSTTAVFTVSDYGQNIEYSVRFLARYPILSGGTLVYWYKVRMTNSSLAVQVEGWIASGVPGDGQRQDGTIEEVLADIPTVGCITEQLPLQAIDGTAIVPFLYAGNSTSAYLAPISGNPVIPIDVGPGTLLRLSAYAVDPETLGNTFWVRAYDVNTNIDSDTANDFNEVWLPTRLDTGAPIDLGGRALSTSELTQEGIRYLTIDQTTLNQLLALPNTDQTARFGGQFDTSNRFPTGGTFVLPDATLYPVEGENTCSTGVRREIHGIGYNLTGDDIYGPGGHTGTDFFGGRQTPPVAYSITGDGMIVGIGIGRTNPGGTIDEEPSTASVYGSAGVEADLYGFSAVVRYGHLYALYGHLTSLESTTFVGARVAAGQQLGTLGNFAGNELHLHLELFSFEQPILPTIFYEMNGSYNPYGILKNELIPLAQRPVNRYNIMQFFAQNGVRDVMNIGIDGLGYQITDGGIVAVNIAPQCLLDFRVTITNGIADVNFGPGRFFRGYTVDQGRAVDPSLPPSIVPQIGSTP